MAAIAAGNACVLKPSELTPAFSALIAELVPKYLDPELYAIINGAIPETTKVGYSLAGHQINPLQSPLQVLEFQWDHSLLACLSTLNLVLTFRGSSIHRGLPCGIHCAYCRRQNIEPSYNRGQHRHQNQYFQTS